MGHVGYRDAMLRGLDLIHANHQSGLRVFDVPVGVNHARRVLKDRLDLLGNLGLASQIWTVNLGHQGLHHRRSRWNFADLNARTVRVSDRVEQRTKPLGNGMALHVALLCREQVHLDVGLIRLVAHVVVAHQPVEVIRAGCPSVSLVVQHVRLPRQLFAQCLGHARRLFQRCAIGHIDDHLQFALVVERQHLDANQSEGHQRHRDQKQHHHSNEKQDAIACGLDQRRHDAAIDPGPPVLRLRFEYFGPFQMPANEPEGSPGRNYKCNQQREEHGRRCAHGDRPHVGPHQAADKGHGQYCRNHGEGGQNGWIAHLGNCFDRDFAHRPTMILRQSEVAHHVFDHDNGIIHKNADRENQSKQRDAVDGVAEEVEDRHGERERDRNSQQYHTRLAPAEEERDEKSDGQGRQQQVLQQFVGLVLGCLAVVARGGHGHVVGNGDALHLMHATEDGVGDVGGIRPLALGHGNRHRRILARCLRRCIA